MYNPSYLIKSRHDIYYFRYPLPVNTYGEEKRVSVSLQTRCPKEALRLAKILEYHSTLLIAGMDWERMSDIDVGALFKQYFANLLANSKARIDRTGPLTKQREREIEEIIADFNMLIDAEVDDIDEYDTGTVDADSWVSNDIQKFMDLHGLDYEADSPEYKLMKSLQKFARRSYFQEVLAYNRKVKDFSFENALATQPLAPRIDKVVSIGHVIDKYLEEIKPDLKKRSFNDQRDCLNYLIDWLGAGYPVIKIDADIARDIKEGLRFTPLSRNVNQLTRGLTITEQIAVAKANGMEMLSNKSVNKYLNYFDNLMKWAVKNKYCEDSPFSMRVKDNKKHNRRLNFSKEEVRQILDGLGDGTTNDVLKNSTQYWGALIAVYTGARLNEIASLMPNDVKQHLETGIWYFDITAEADDGKELKTEAAQRVVPIHSRLLDLGLLDFVEEARGKQGKKDKFGHEPRLLYQLAYTEHDKWGRKLGRWFNNNYLPALGLKGKKKSLHSLRHSMITSLSAAGVGDATIKSMVGHEPDTVTTSVYTHYGVDHLPVFKEAIEKLPY